MEDFEIIYKLMQQKNISQKQLADFLGVSEQKISDWKANRIKSWIKHIDKIATCLDVTIGDCLGMTPEAFIEKEKLTDQIDELKENLRSVINGLSRAELEKLLEHAELLESARKTKTN